MNSTTTATDVRVPAPAVVQGRRIAWWELAAVSSAMAVVAVIGVFAIRRGVPFLWDEAVYGLRVRDLIGEGVRGFYWMDVRAPGLPLLVAPIAALAGATDTTLRATSLAFAVAGVGIIWVTARLLTGPGVAAVAAWLLAIAPGWHDSSWQLMPDIPGATLTLAAMVVILRSARGGRLSWWALAAAPLAFAATMVRYGAPLLIGPTILAALLLRWPVVRVAPLRAAAALAAPAIAAGLVWFVPQVTGSPRPPVLIYRGRQDVKAIPAAESAADFLASLGGLVGPLFGALIVVGAVAASFAARRDTRMRNAAIAGGLIALSVLIAMLLGIAEYHVRYLTPALPFLALLAAVGLVQVSRAIPARALTAAIAAAIALAGTGLATRTAIERGDHITHINGGARAAYRYIDARTAGPCVVLDRHATNEWYSHCAAFRPLDTAKAIRGLTRRGVTPDERMYAIVRRPDPTPPPGQRPTGGTLEGAEAAVIDDLALARVEITPQMTVIDVGTYGRFVQAFRERGLSEQR